MITKERLEELIKEGATIYYLSGHEVSIIFLNEDWSVDNVYFGGGEAERWLYYKDIIYKPLNQLFETQKQAEWALRYYATRTEELDLPMWEEFCKLCELVVNFEIQITDKNKVVHLLYKSGNYINIWNMDDKTVEFSEKATEENYIKACDLCLKLFKGEEDGN